MMRENDILAMIIYGLWGGHFTKSLIRLVGINVFCEAGSCGYSCALGGLLGSHAPPVDRRFRRRRRRRLCRAAKMYAKNYDAWLPRRPSFAHGYPEDPHLRMATQKTPICAWLPRRPRMATQKYFDREGGVPAGPCHTTSPGRRETDAQPIRMRRCGACATPHVTQVE